MGGFKHLQKRSEKAGFSFNISKEEKPKLVELEQTAKKTGEEAVVVTTVYQETAQLEKVIQINRIAKVVKGGRRFHFSALVVIGNGAGKVGYALEKASEVSDAIRKALAVARKKQIAISLRGTTIPHEVIGRYGAAKVLLKPAVEGTGVIAGGAVRAVCESCGIKDILTKSLGSDNAINVLKATISGLQSLISRGTVRQTEGQNKSEGEENLSKKA